MDFIALDFETANFKRQSICSVGLVVVKNNEIIKTINRLVKPSPNYFERINTSVHGITNKDVENEPTFNEVWSDIKEYFDNANVVAHNAAFDMSALRYALDEFSIPYPKLHYYCTMQITKNLYKGFLNYQLPTICRQLNIDGLNHHNAISDAIACSKIASRMLQDFEVGSLEEFSKRFNFRKGEFLKNSYIPFSCCGHRISKPKLLFDISAQIEESEKNEEHPFFSKNIVFTGKLYLLTRQDAINVVQRIGGYFQNSVSSKTDYLVLGKLTDNKKSSKQTKAEDLLSKGEIIEIIGEEEFYKMVHIENTSFEINKSIIEECSDFFLKRNKYNDFSRKNVYFSEGLPKENYEEFQMVGDCSGYGHNYDQSEIPNTHFYIVSNIVLKDLNKGIKTKSIIEIEEIISKRIKEDDKKVEYLDTNNPIDVFKNIGLFIIHEDCFYEYIERRKRFIKNEVKMNIFEHEVEEKYRL